jgi:tetratricopeptide (TPR) repeat protein
MNRALFSIATAALFLSGCAHQPPSFTSPKLDILNEQVRMNSSDAQAHSNRGYTLALLGRDAEARADIEKALQLKNTAPLHNGAGWAYFNLRDYSTALREWQLAASMSHNRAHYDYYSLALGYWGVGDKKRALENYQLAVQREPRFGQAKTLLERVAEWTPLEQHAIREIYSLWSKTWRPE